MKKTKKIPKRSLRKARGGMHHDYFGGTVNQSGLFTARSFTNLPVSMQQKLYFQYNPNVKP